MRTVIQGTPTTKRRVRPQDLPPDNDLRHSFWRYVICDLDLSAYDMTDMDILDSRMDGCVLGEGKTGYLMSRRTSWRNATLPPDVSSYNHDLVWELYRQAPNWRHPINQYVRDHIFQNYNASWSTFFWHCTRDLGVTVQEILDASVIAYDGKWPRMQSRMKHHADAPDGGEAETMADLSRTEVGGIDRRVLLAAGKDRWALARMLEQATRTDVRKAIHIAQLEPYPVISVATFDEDKTDAEWWKRKWPVG